MPAEPASSSAAAGSSSTRSATTTGPTVRKAPTDPLTDRFLAGPDDRLGRSWSTRSRGRGPRPDRVAPAIEEAIPDHALTHPTRGPMRVARELAQHGLQVSPGGVRGVWSRHDLLTNHEPLLRLEKATAERLVELTPELARLLERFSPEFRERHIDAAHTGDLMAVDTLFVGVLKGVGNAYPPTVIDCHPRFAPDRPRRPACLRHRSRAVHQRKAGNGGPGLQQRGPALLQPARALSPVRQEG